MRNCFLLMSRESVFLRKNLLLVKMMRRLLEWQKDLVYYIKLKLIKQWQALRGLTLVMQKVLLWVKWYQKHRTLQRNCLWKSVNRCGKLQPCLTSRNCHSHPTFSNHHPDQSAAVNIKAKRLSTSKNYNLLKTQMMVYIFSV